MLNVRTSAERGVPLWAFGAPLVGVPIMVALLAIAAPHAVGFEQETTIEELQVQELAQTTAPTHECATPSNDS